MIKRIKFFLKESQIELKKVTWPSTQMLKRTTLVVIFITILMAVFVGIIDIIFSKMLGLIAR